MCQMKEDLLHEYIDASIGQLERIILVEHLKNCADCRQELNRLKLIDWELSRMYEEEVVIPTELVNFRINVLEKCFWEEGAQDTTNSQSMTSTDMWKLQAATFNNSWKFLSLMPSLPKKEKAETRKPKKKASLLRKIIGL